MKLKTLLSRDYLAAYSFFICFKLEIIAFFFQKNLRKYMIYKNTSPSSIDDIAIKWSHKVGIERKLIECIGFSPMILNGFSKEIFVEIFNNSQKPLTVQIKLENIKKTNSELKFIFLPLSDKTLKNQDSYTFEISEWSTLATKFAIRFNNKLNKKHALNSAIFSIFVDKKLINTYKLQAKTKNWHYRHRSKILSKNCFNPYRGSQSTTDTPDNFSLATPLQTINSSKKPLSSDDYHNNVPLINPDNYNVPNPYNH